LRKHERQRVERQRRAEQRVPRHPEHHEAAEQEDERPAAAEHRDGVGDPLADRSACDPPPRGRCGSPSGSSARCRAQSRSPTSCMIRERSVGRFLMNSTKVVALERQQLGRAARPPRRPSAAPRRAARSSPEVLLPEQRRDCGQPAACPIRRRCRPRRSRSRTSRIALIRPARTTRSPGVDRAHRGACAPRARRSSSSRDRSNSGISLHPRYGPSCRPRYPPSRTVRCLTVAPGLFCAPTQPPLSLRRRLNTSRSASRLLSQSGLLKTVVTMNRQSAALSVGDVTQTAGVQRKISTETSGASSSSVVPSRRDACGCPDDPACPGS